MQGTRDAALNWRMKRSETAKKFGFNVGKAFPCHFYRHAWDMSGLVPSDHFVFAGAEDRLKAISTHMTTRFGVKVALVGPGLHGPLRVLNLRIWAERCHL